MKSFSSLSQGAMNFMNRPKATSSGNLINQRIKIGKMNFTFHVAHTKWHMKYSLYRQNNITQHTLFTEPTNYRGVVRPNQPFCYKVSSSCPMIPPLSETPTPGTLSQAWAGQVSSNGASNGVGLQQVNPGPSMATTGDSGNSLPLLTSLDLECLQSNGPTSSQSRQDQPNQQVQQSQQPSQRQGLEGAHTWYNYGSQQPQSTQNGATGTGGSLGTGYSYTSNMDDQFFQNLIENHHMKQETQGPSNMASLGPACTPSSDYAQSFTALLNCPNTNVSALESMRPMETSGPNQMVSQIQYPSSNMGQDSHLDSFPWQYFPE